MLHFYLYNLPSGTRFYCFFSDCKEFHCWKIHCNLCDIINSHSFTGKTTDGISTKKQITYRSHPLDARLWVSLVLCFQLYRGSCERNNIFWRFHDLCRDLPLPGIQFLFVNSFSVNFVVVDIVVVVQRTQVFKAGNSLDRYQLVFHERVIHEYGLDYVLLGEDLDDALVDLVESDGHVDLLDRLDVQVDLLDRLNSYFDAIDEPVLQLFNRLAFLSRLINDAVILGTQSSEARGSFVAGHR